MISILGNNNESDAASCLMIVVVFHLFIRIANAIALTTKLATNHPQYIIKPAILMEGEKIV